MGALHRPHSGPAFFRGLAGSLLFAALLGFASSIAAAPAIDARAISGYTSLEERITEYLFDGEESQPMWA